MKSIGLVDTLQVLMDRAGIYASRIFKYESVQIDESLQLYWAVFGAASVHKHGWTTSTTFFPESSWKEETVDSLYSVCESFGKTTAFEEEKSKSELKVLSGSDV